MAKALGDPAALWRLAGRAADDSELLVRAGLCSPRLSSTTAGAACNDGDEKPVLALAELLTCNDESVVKPALTDVCSAEDDDVNVGLSRVTENYQPVRLITSYWGYLSKGL